VTVANEDGAAALLALLDALGDALDELTIAVERRDLGRLVGATAAAEGLSGAIRERARALPPEERAQLDRHRLRDLTERLAAAARRNAYLIEQAWSLDAATMRLLIALAQGVGGAGEGTASSGYPIAGPEAPAYLDRQA
jgi:hypothetical protein